MATTTIYQEAQPQWPFMEKSLPTINLVSIPPAAPYPDTFEAIEGVTTTSPPIPIPASIGPFLRFSYAIYGFNHVIYYN